MAWHPSFWWTRSLSVSSWKDTLCQDNGLKCPVGLLAHWPFSLGHVVATVGPAASGFQMGPPATAVHTSVSGLMAQSLRVMDLDLLGFLGPGLDLVPALRESQYLPCFLSPGESTQEPFKAQKAQVKWEDATAPLGLGHDVNEKVRASLVLPLATLQSFRLQKGN